MPTWLQAILTGDTRIIRLQREILQRLRVDRTQQTQLALLWVGLGCVT